MLKRNSINVHSNTWQLAVQIWRLSKVKTGWPGGCFGSFLNFFPKSPLLPCIPHRSRLFWLNSSDTMEFSSWKRFIMWLLSKLLYKGSACFDRPEYWMKFVLRNCKKLHSVQGLYDKETAPHSRLPQMWCMKSMKSWFTRHQICWPDSV